MKTIRRVLRYARGKYKLVILSLIMIVLVNLLVFIAPFINKVVLDDCVLGIEKDWVEVDYNTTNVIKHNDRYFIQKRFLRIDNSIFKDIMGSIFRFNEDEVDYDLTGFIKDVSIIVHKTSFYFVEEKVKIGTKTLEIVDGEYIFSVSVGNEVYKYVAEKLDVNQVKIFYHPIIKLLIVLIIIAFVRSFLTILFSYIRAISANRVMNRMGLDARREAMRCIERMKISYFEGEPAGKTASRIINDVNGIVHMVTLFLNTIINAFLAFVLAYIGMFILNPTLALITFIIYPLAYLWIRLFLKFLKKIAYEVNEKRRLLTGKINEIINGINILQIFNFKEQTVSEFNEISVVYKNEQLKEVKLHVIGGWNMMGMVRALITTLVVVFFGWRYFTIAEVIITAGMIVAFNEFILRIINPIQILLSQISGFQHAIEQVEGFYKIIDADLEDEEFYDIPRFKGEIKFEDVWFWYTKDEYVLKGVSFEIKAGQLIGLVGHTGSGKSSLMNLLLRFYDLSEENGGRILVDDVNITTYSKRSYRQHIGIVLQEPVLFQGTIASNVRFGKDEVSDQEIEDVIISMGGRRLLDKFKEGIHHPITRAGVNMSSGEKQILALARAVIHDPAILIMDEATSHIDVETEEMIKQALNVACIGRTVIIIAHRLSTIHHASKIIVLEHGLKIEEGRHEELIRLNGKYANMYRAQLNSMNDAYFEEE